MEVLGPLTERNRIYKTLIISAGILTFFVTLLTGGVSTKFFLVMAALIITAEFLFRLYHNGTIFPYLLMLISPVTLLSYSTTADFTIRIISLLFLCYISSAPFIQIRPLRKITKSLRNPFVVWVIPMLLFVLLSIWLDHKGVQLSGDEPHYLMVTQSIVEDHDLSLRNNVEDKTYMDFIPAELPPHMIIHKGKYLSFHMPGLSLLLIPFYIIFKLTGNIISPHLFFRISISVINSLFPFILYFLMKSFFPGKKIAGIWFLSILTVPLLFHSVHIFPELPAASLLAASFLFMFRNEPKPVLAGFLFSLTIWFHVKYYPLLFIFALFALWKLFRENNKSDLLKFLIYPAISSIVLLLFSKAVYGTFNPAGIFPAENYWSTPLILKLKVFAAYFIDQRDGLLFYAPSLFLFLFGIRSRGFLWKIPLTLLGTYTLFHAVTTVRGAHAPVGRPLIFVLWIILLFGFNYYFKSDRKHLFKLLTGMNMFILYWILNYPQFIYQPVFASTSDGGSSLIKFMGSNTLDLTNLFPSFLTNRSTFHMPNIIWISLILITTAAFYSRRVKGFKVSLTAMRSGATIFFLLAVFLISVFPHVHISASDRFRRDGISLFNTSSNFVWLESENCFRIKGNEEYTIHFEERKWKKKISLIIEVPERSSLIIKNKKNVLLRVEKPGEVQLPVNLSEMGTFKLKGKELIPIWIKTGSETDTEFFFLRIKNR